VNKFFFNFSTTSDQQLNYFSDESKIMFNIHIADLLEKSNMTVRRLMHSIDEEKEDDWTDLMKQLKNYEKAQIL
jgi:hypothetical protein